MPHRLPAPHQPFGMDPEDPDAPAMDEGHALMQDAELFEHEVEVENEEQPEEGPSEQDHGAELYNEMDNYAGSVNSLPPLQLGVRMRNRDRSRSPLVRVANPQVVRSSAEEEQNRSFEFVDSPPMYSAGLPPGLGTTASRVPLFPSPRRVGLGQNRATNATQTQTMPPPPPPQYSSGLRQPRMAPQNLFGAPVQYGYPGAGGEVPQQVQAQNPHAPQMSRQFAPVHVAGHATPEMMRYQREAKDEERNYRSAKKQIGSYQAISGKDPMTWCNGFKLITEELNLSASDKKRLFMELVDELAFKTAHMENDRKRGQIANLGKWMERLIRDFGNLARAKMQLLRNEKQKPDEDANTYVQRILGRCRDADPDISQASIIEVIEAGIHPDYKHIYNLMGLHSETPKAVVMNLSRAMSTDLGVMRARMNQLGAEATATTPKSSEKKTEKKSSSTTSSALVMQVESTPTSSRGRGQGRGRGRGYGPQNQAAGYSARPAATATQNAAAGYTASNKPCYGCGQPGHFKNVCPQRVNQQGQTLQVQTQSGFPAQTEAGRAGVYYQAPQNMQYVYGPPPQNQVYYVPAGQPQGQMTYPMYVGSNRVGQPNQAPTNQPQIEYPQTPAPERGSKNV